MQNRLPLLPDFVARAIENWASRKQDSTQLNTVLSRKRIYILPTAEGIVFTFVLLVILAGAINYENSLAYLLTFLLLGMGLVSMIFTHQNLNQLSIHCLLAKPVFAGQHARFPVQISSTANRDYYSLVLQSNSEDSVNTDIISSKPETIVDIPLLAEKRGIQKLGKIKIFTEFPLGFFHAWSWLRLDAKCIVYPMPATHPPHYKNISGSQTNDILTEKSGNDDFAGIRDYQKGDSSRQIAWKASARSGKLQSKVFHETASEEIWLRWQDLPPGMDIEQRLSVLCRWILDCDSKGINYGLVIPGKTVSPGSGLHHRHETLTSLALFQSVKND